MDTLVALVTAKPLVLRIGAEDGAQELGQIVRGDDRKLRISPVAGSPLEGIDLALTTTAVRPRQPSVHICTGPVCTYAPAPRVLVPV
jgi:hypothetical protein